METQQYRRKLDELKARRKLLQEDLATAKAKRVLLEEGHDNLTKARVLVQEAALMTQEHLRVRLSSIVTTALQAVWPERDLDFRITFESKRGRTECVLEVGEQGVYTAPMDSNGGGLLDLVSFALRASFWSIDRTRPVLILDEPMKFLSPKLAPLAADMLRMVSDKLRVQIIMVTHVPAFVESADRVFEVERVGMLSTVKETK